MILTFAIVLSFKYNGSLVEHHNFMQIHSITLHIRRPWEGLWQLSGSGSTFPSSKNAHTYITHQRRRCFVWLFICIDNYDSPPSRCPESAAEEDISIVALLAPISSKQMHLSLFTISAILPLTTHRRQVINTEEEQFIFIACNHSKHPHGLSVPPRQVEGGSQIISPLWRVVHHFAWVIPLVQSQEVCQVYYAGFIVGVFFLSSRRLCGAQCLSGRCCATRVTVVVWYNGFY